MKHKQGADKFDPQALALLPTFTKNTGSTCLLGVGKQQQQATDGGKAAIVRQGGVS